MIDRIHQFLSGRAPATFADDASGLRDAVAALLIEAARMDDDFDATERATIERLLAGRFELAPAEAQALVETAERMARQSTQVFPFIQQVVRQLAPEDRVHIVEMLWQVAYADGVLDPQEDMLLRRIAGLIFVPDRERGEARLRVLERLGAAKEKEGWAD